MKLILLGAPGAGKGTQAEVLSKQLNIPTISTGNMLRAAMAESSPLGQQVKSLMDDGKLVPDNVIIDLVKDRIAQEDCANGFILDGMPRTIPQARALLDNEVQLDAALSLEVNDEEIIERMSGRRVCTKCGATYHLVSNPPAEAGVCDNCGEALVIRKDDAPEKVRYRLNTYHLETEPLKDFYRNLGILVSVESTGSIQEVSKAIFQALGIAE